MKKKPNPNPTNQDKPGPKQVYFAQYIFHSNFANAFWAELGLGRGVSKVGRDEMSGILQES